MKNQKEGREQEKQLEEKEEEEVVVEEVVEEVVVVEVEWCDASFPRSCSWNHRWMNGTAAAALAAQQRAVEKL